MTTQLMPETPIIAINVLFTFIVVMGVRRLEALSRTAEIMLTFLYFFIYFFYCLYFPTS